MEWRGVFGEPQMVLWIPKCLRTSDMRPSKELGGKVMAEKLPKDPRSLHFTAMLLCLYIPAAEDWTPGAGLDFL